MPRVTLGSNNCEKNFGAKLNAQIVEKRLRRDKVAQKIGVCDKTLKSRFDTPHQMTLGQLKLFIKVTGLSKESIIEYLYEGRE